MKRFGLLNLITGYCFGNWGDEEEAEHYRETLDDFNNWIVDEI